MGEKASTIYRVKISLTKEEYWKQHEEITTLEEQCFSCDDKQTAEKYYEDNKWKI